MRRDVMSALHLIGVECPAGLRRLTMTGESAQPGSLVTRPGGLICRALRLNRLLPLVAAFLSFPTGLIADALRHDDTSCERVYVTLYGLTLLAISLLGSAPDAYARHEHLYPPAKGGEELHSTQRKSLRAVIGYVITILIGLALRVAAVALYFSLAVYLVVPFREAARY
jgi:hypothetical protein